MKQDAISLDELKIDIPLKTLRELRVIALEARTPKVTFQRDVLKMRDEAEEVTKNKISYIIATLDKYLP